MTEGEWQARVTREAGKAIGEWLEGRGKLHQPIASLTRADLEGMAAAATARFVVLTSERLTTAPVDAEDLIQLLLG